MAGEALFRPHRRIAEIDYAESRFLLRRKLSPPLVGHVVLAFRPIRRGAMARLTAHAGLLQLRREHRRRTASVFDIEGVATGGSLRSSPGSWNPQDAADVCALAVLLLPSTANARLCLPVVLFPKRIGFRRHEHEINAGLATVFLRRTFVVPPRFRMAPLASPDCLRSDSRSRSPAPADLRARRRRAIARQPGSKGCRQ